jgi:hypothetical protein
MCVLALTIICTSESSRILEWSRVFVIGIFFTDEIVEVEAVCEFIIEICFPKLSSSATIEWPYKTLKVG